MHNGKKTSVIIEIFGPDCLILPYSIIEVREITKFSMEAYVYFQLMPIKMFIIIIFKVNNIIMIDK